MLASSPQVSSGAVQKMSAATGFDQPVVLMVKSLERKDGNKYAGILSDGTQEINARFASQFSEMITSGGMKEGSVVRLGSYVVNHVNNASVVMVTDLEVVEAGAGTVELKKEAVSTPDMKKTPTTNKENRGPFLGITPGPTPSPSEEPSAKVAKTPAVPTPGSVHNKTPTLPTPGSANVKVMQATTPPKSDRKVFHKIGALHPYDDQWCIKAKVERKNDMRTINSQKGSMAVFSCELVDDQGSQIQATFWRGQAERYAETLEEGKVYVFAKFQVKPCNKQYSSVKNDYEIHFSDRTEVGEAQDQEAAANMTAAVEIVPIDCLLKHITRKAPVDIMGVITSAGTVGTVKRKSDDTQLTRREVTLVDQSGKSVALTMWGDNATSSMLEGAEGSVLQVTACRVTDFNGCSLSTLGRSVVTFDPDTSASQELKSWYQGQSSSSFTAVGQDAPNARSGDRRQDQIQYLDQVNPAPGANLPEPDAKPSWHSVMANVASISADQTMYYLANPENGRKVVEQERRFYCNHKSEYIDHAEHRYVLSLKGIDPTGDCWLNMFNEQAEMVLGIKADDLAAMKSSEPERFAKKLKDAQWGGWVMTVSSKTREYNGEVKMRHTVTAVRPIDFVADSQRFLDLIMKY